MATTYPNGVAAPSPGDPIPADGASGWQLVASTADTAIGAASFAKPQPAPFDFDTFKQPGSYAMGSPFPDGWANTPPQITTAAVVNIYGSPGRTWCAQEIIQYGPNPVRMWRVSSTTSLWNPWVVVGARQGSAMASNAALQTDFISKTGGIVNTGGKAGFAIRLDHGWTNIKSKLRAELIARGIVPGVATNSRNWGLAENAGVTLAEVNTWVANGEFEIINHSATHYGGLNEAQLVDEIVTGKLELETQLPAAAPIHGFAPPGVTEGWDGFNGGRIDGWLSPAAQIILGSHAYCLGYVGGARRVMDGTIRQGLSHTTLDTYDLQIARNQIDSAIIEKRGIQFMIHPRELDLPGAITTAEFLSFLDYAVAKRDAGDLVFMSPGEMVRGDASMRTPAVHTHAQGDVTGLGAALDGKVSTTDPRLSDARTPKPHTHVVADTTGLQAALDGKLRKEPINLGSENLNTILDDGPYSQSSSATATAALNYPVNSNGLYTAGTLKVTSRVGDSLVVQEYVSYNGKDSFWRAYYLGTWYPWERSAKASELDPVTARVATLEQDTGARNIATLATGMTAGTWTLRRAGKWVFMNLYEAAFTSTGTWQAPSGMIPTGFRPPAVPAYVLFPGAARVSTMSSAGVRISRYGGVDVYDVATKTISVTASWMTDDAWPGTLPGTPA